MKFSKYLHLNELHTKDFLIPLQQIGSELSKFRLLKKIKVEDQLNTSENYFILENQIRMTTYIFGHNFVHITKW